MQHREWMTSRQRVMATLDHREPDRMPIDLGVHFASGISAFAYCHLREYLGLSTDRIVIPDMVQFLARVDDDVLERLHIDTRLLFPGFRTTRRWNPRGRYGFTIPGTAQPVLNAKGEWIVERNGVMRMPSGGYFFDGDWLSFDDRSGEERLEATAREAERIYKDTDAYTVYLQYGAFFNGSDEGSLCRLLLEPDAVKEENERVLAWYQEDMGRVIDRMGRYIQGVELASDLGTQSGPLCDPKVYADLSFPYLKRFCDFIHAHSDLKVQLHCCGSIRPLIPLLIEAGIDVLNPVQITADDMDPATLKREFGDRIAFWGGGCDTQRVLGVASPDAVRRNVRDLVRIFKPGGGFVFNQVHNIMGDVPPENILAMLETAYEESFYGTADEAGTTPASQ